MQDCLYYKEYEVEFEQQLPDYFDEAHYEIYRKKILDNGNCVLRDYNSELENLTVEFRFKQ